MLLIIIWYFFHNYFWPRLTSLQSTYSLFYRIVSYSPVKMLRSCNYLVGPHVVAAIWPCACLFLAVFTYEDGNHAQRWTDDIRDWVGKPFADCIRAKLMERTGTHSVQSDTTSAFSATDTPVVTPV